MSRRNQGAVTSLQAMRARIRSCCEGLWVPKAAIVDLDGTLLDSVDLHTIAWHGAMVRFGHDVSFEQARSLQLAAIREFGGRQREVVQADGFTASTSAVLLLGVENGRCRRLDVGLGPPEIHPIGNEGGKCCCVAL